MIHYLRALATRLRGLFGHRRAEQEIDDEIEMHLRLLTERYVRQGMSETEAARAARRQLTYENDSYNFLHSSNLALLPYLKLFQDPLNPYLTGHLLNRFGEYRLDVNRQPPPIAYRFPILGL